MTSANRSNRDGAIVAEITPFDPDLELTADYLAGSATPEQREEFERRFVEDEAFFDSVAPAIKAWRMPVNLRELMARSAASSTAAGLAPSTVPVPVPEAAAPASPPRSRVARSRYRRVRRAFHVVFKAVVAASLFGMFAIQAYVYYGMGRGDEIKAMRQTLQQHSDAVAAATNAPAPATILPGGPRVSAAVVPRAVPPAPVKAPAVSAPTTVPRPDTVRKARPDSSPPARTDSLQAQYALIRATAIALGTEHRTGESETRVVEFPNGVRVQLRPNTFIRVLPFLMVPSDRPVALYLEGELAVEFPVAGVTSTTMMTVTSAAGRVTAMSSGTYEGTRFIAAPTSFAARCLRACAAMEVAVAAGEVSIDRGQAQGAITLNAGQLGVAPATRAPSRVDVALAALFPRPDSSIRKEP